MSTCAKYNKDHINDLLNLKEQEWRCALQEHIDTLVKELAEKDEHLRLEKVRFNKLKDDFKYNLQLVEDRDRDLQRYEQLFEQMKGNDKLNNHQVSEMKIKVDEFQNRFNLLQKEKEEMQHHYQMRLKDYQDEMTKFYKKKEAEHKKEKNEYEELKRKLQRKIRDNEQELEFEKQKMLKEIEENSRQAEQEYQIKLDQNEADIHAYELKVKMLSRELEMVQNSNKEVMDNLENNKENAVQYARLLKEKEWELQDLRNMKELKIRELENQLEEVQKSSKWKMEEFERKYCALEKLCNEREDNLSTLKTAVEDSELKLREDLKIALQQKEDVELENKRLQWKITDMQVASQKEVQSHSQRAEQLEKNMKEEMDMMNKETVAKDMEYQALRSKEELLKKESVKLKNVVERLKKELTSSMDRERILENAKVQLELDWRRRFETKESDLYEQHDKLVKKLTDEVDEASQGKKRMEMELRRRENLINLLEDDKAIAIKTLKENGISTDNMFAEGVPERDFDNLGDNGQTKDLEKQNSQLKEVIKEMRSEMEMLSQQITSNTSTPNKDKEDKSSYVQDLEAEVQKLKSSNRNLMLKLEDATREDKPPLEGILKSNVAISDPGVQNYVKELNGTIGALRNEKVLITASLNKKDATINHLNETIGKLTNEKQQQTVQIDNLNFDMTSKAKAFEQNISSLKSRISELELHLQQARSEADIYYKSVMERNSDATQANNKLSELKILNSAYTNVSSNCVPDSKPPSFYKDKLKLAVERIKELAVERSQLINLGNKLRFELNRIKETYQLGESEEQVDNVKSSKIRNYGNQLQSKLDKLELMKYEATVNELRNAPKKKPNVDIKLMTSSAELSEITDDDAPSLKESVKENQPPSQQNHQQTLLQSSSDHSSINEIWKMLENADDISSIPEKDQSDDLALVGKHIKPDERKSHIKSPVLKQKKLTKIKKKALIRNYNQKDDKK